MDMTTKDEEIQNQIENTVSPVEGVDAYAYKKVFDALKQEPDFRLPVNFADRMVQKIEARKESSTDFIWLGIGIFAFTLAAIVAIVLTDFKFSFEAWKFMAGYRGLFAFGSGFILLLHWLDKKLIRTSRHISDSQI
jgi:hypothetical protein